MFGRNVKATSATGPPAGADTKAWFATTHWGTVLQARDGSSGEAPAALDQLFRIYWPPLYAFIRRQGHAPEAAQDLTQEFLARFAEKNYLSHLTHQEGKFRSFLLKVLTHFLSDQRDRARAQKRGGGLAPVFLDALSEEERWSLEPAENAPPEAVYDRRWAQTVLTQAAARLREQYGGSEEKARLFEALKEFQPGAETSPSYGELAARLGMTESAVATAVHRFRKRYSEALREVIAQTVGRPEEVEEEIRYLIQVLRG